MAPVSAAHSRTAESGPRVCVPRGRWFFFGDVGEQPVSGRARRNRSLWIRSQSVDGLKKGGDLRRRGIENRNCPRAAGNARGVP